MTSTGRPLHLNHLSQVVRGYVRQAGIAKRGACHLFRHTAATLMLEAGADIRFIQALLGHSKLNTTEIYTHVTIDKLREVHQKTHPAKFKPRDGSGVRSPRTRTMRRNRSNQVNFRGGPLHCSGPPLPVFDDVALFSVREKHKWPTPG